MITKRPKLKLTETKRLSHPANGNYNLRLYIAGETPNAVTALKNLKLICEERLKGKYSIKVFDLLKDPKIGHDDQILAIPTLMRKQPRPVKLVIGDLSDTKRLLAGLDLK